MPSRLLSIAADLSAPPSSPSCFRDVTLQGAVRGYEVVAVVEEGTPCARDSYLNWFRQYGLLDYVADLLLPYEIQSQHVTVQITGGRGARLTAANLHEVLSYL